MKKAMHRVISFLMALILVIGMLPPLAYAEEVNFDFPLLENNAAEYSGAAEFEQKGEFSTEEIAQTADTIEDRKSVV